MSIILTINPGSTSTKLGVFQIDDQMNLQEIICENIMHNPEELKSYQKPIEQFQIRLNYVNQFIEKKNLAIIDCIVSRGGLVRPVAAGSYAINEAMIDDLSCDRFGSHISNLSPLLAKKLSENFNCPAIIVDPVGVDEFTPFARYTGFPGIERRSQSHALNVRATARQAAIDLGLELNQANFIVAHLGGGITIAALQQGRLIDVNNANDGGPFSPQRAGTLPTTQLVKLCFSGKYKSAEELNYVLTRQSGLLGYLGTDDGREIIRRIQSGDNKAQEVLMAMAYQISKEISAMAAVLKGKVNAIVITGGLARPPLTDWISDHTQWIAPLKSYPNSQEELALAKAGARFLMGQEELKLY